MKNIPEFNAEYAQVVEYIFDSDLAKKTFQDPPFKNYNNILRETLAAIDRLSDNCHMPEFTNHALPHICSVIKRASEWGVNSGWIEKISSQESGYLLLALVIHDIGMLSQDSSHLPDNKKIDSKKGMSEISTWVRKTHVDRLEKLFFSIVADQSKGIEDSIKLIIEMASTHSVWPWEAKFDVSTDLCKKSNVNKENILSLCAVIAVTDLLDEDSNRCDTITLIKHKHGTIENISHWIRHALTVSVSAVENKKIRIKFRTLPNLPSDFIKVYQALRNHYRLIKLYNSHLCHIGGEIDGVEFDPSDKVDYFDSISESLSIWNAHIELKNNITRRIMDTFMPEAKGIYIDDISEKNIKAVGMETISYPQNNNTETIEEQLVAEATTTNICEILNHLKQKTETAYLDGKMGTVRHLCYLAIEALETAGVIPSIKNIYWVLSYMTAAFRKTMDIHKLDDLYAERPAKNAKLIKDNYSYKVLFDFINSLLNLEFSDERLNENFAECKKIKSSELEDDLPTALLIETISNFLCFVNEEKAVDFVSDIITNIKDSHKIVFQMLESVNKRLVYQKLIFSKDNFIIPESTAGILEWNAYAWRCFYDNNWGDLEKCINMLAQKINSKDESFTALIGLINMVSGHIDMQNYNRFSNLQSSKYQKYQRLESELPINTYIEEMCREIEIRIMKIHDNPHKASQDRRELLRYIIHLEAYSKKYWNLGLYLSAQKYMLEFACSMTLYRSDNGVYSGFADWGKDCIIFAIKTLKSKCVNEETKKDIIGIIENKCPKTFNEVYDYIIVQSHKAEWFNCFEWMEVLGDNIPDEKIDMLIKWTVSFAEFSKEVKYRYNLSQFNYLEPVFKNYTLSEQQWELLQPICDSLLMNSATIRTCEKLCFSILEAMPLQRCVNTLSRIVDQYTGNADIENLHTLIYNLSVTRDEFLSHGIEILKTLDTKVQKPSIKEFISYLETPVIAERDDFDEEEIFEHFTKDLNALAVTTVYSSYSNMSFYYTNINWNKAKKRFINKIFSTFEKFIKSNNNLYDSYFSEALLIMRTIVSRLSDDYKKRYISFVLELIKSDYNTQKNPMNGSISTPMSSAIFKDSMDDYQTYTYAYTMSEFCRSMNYEQMHYSIKWIIAKIPESSNRFLYYYSYFASYCFITQNNNVKQLSYTALMMLKMRIDTQGDLHAAVTGIIKGIEHLLQHDDEKDSPMIKRVFGKKNTPYINFIVWLIKSAAKSFDFELRLRCAALIKLFADNKIKALDKEFEEVRKLLSQDSRKSIRNILN